MQVDIMTCIWNDGNLELGLWGVKRRFGLLKGGITTTICGKWGTKYIILLSHHYKHGHCDPLRDAIDKRWCKASQFPGRDGLFGSFIGRNGLGICSRHVVEVISPCPRP